METFLFEEVRVSLGLWWKWLWKVIAMRQTLCVMKQFNLSFLTFVYHERGIINLSMMHEPKEPRRISKIQFATVIIRARK